MNRSLSLKKKSNSKQCIVYIVVMNVDGLVVKVGLAIRRLLVRPLTPNVVPVQVTLNESKM